MKKLIFTLAVLTVAISTVHAANLPTNTSAHVLQATTGAKYAILVQSIKNLRSSIMTATEMKQANTAIAFEIVIMGQMVQDLNKAELRAVLDTAHAAGIKLVVCEFALNVYEVKLSDLPPYFIGTPNAHKYMFQLQENKYNTLSI